MEVVKGELEDGKVKVEDVISSFIKRLNEEHLELEPNTELDQEDLDHIDLLAEHESILFINLLQRTSPDYDEDECFRSYI